MEPAASEAPSSEFAPEHKVFVVIGPSLSGKSTFINAFLDQQVAQEGEEGDNESCTKLFEMHHNYDQQLGVANILQENNKGGTPPFAISIMDTVGLGDSDVTFYDTEIMDNMKACLLETSSSNAIDAIFIVQNALTLLQIKPTLEKVLQSFGEHSKTHVIVIITNGVLAQQKRQKALQNILKQCQELELKVILWESKTTDEKTRIQQRKDLFEIISKMPPFPLTELQELEERIQQRAMEIQKEKLILKRSVRPGMESKFKHFISEKTGRHTFQLSKGKQWKEGYSYSKAYKECFIEFNKLLFSRCSKEQNPIFDYSAKTLCLITYPITPVSTAIEVLVTDKYKEEVIDEVTAESKELDNYLLPIDKSAIPELQYIVPLARNEEAQRIRYLINKSKEENRKHNQQ